MVEKKIKMAQVLAEIDQYEQGGKIHVFSLNYVKKNGQKGHKHLVRKSGTKVKTGETKIGTGFKIRVKENGLLMLVDHINDQPFALKISLITHYNGIRIQH